MNRTDITVKNRWISLHGKSKKEQQLHQQQQQQQIQQQQQLQQQEEEQQDNNIEASLQEIPLKEEKIVDQIVQDLKITEAQND